MTILRKILFGFTGLLISVCCLAYFIPSFNEKEKRPIPEDAELPGNSIPTPFFTPLHPQYIVDVANTYKVKAGSPDNTYELLRMNANFEGFGKGLILFDFRNCGKGEIRYSDNSWLHGIDSFIVSAQGITFRCTSTSPWDVAKAPFFNGGIYWPGRRPQALPATEGLKFKSAEKGAYTITLTEPEKFSAGDRVYMAGYEEQFYGEPVNPRFFEWKTVTSISGNALTFTEPLKWSYNEHWKDVQMQGWGLFGKPRVFKIPSTYPRFAKFVGCSMAKGTNASGPAYFIFKAETLICDSVNIEENWPTETKNALFINCTIGGSDLDKNVGVCEYNNCTTGGIYAATGVDSLRLIGNRISNYSPLSPRVLYAERNYFTSKDNNPPLYPHPEGTWVEKVYLKRNVFKGGYKKDAHVRYDQSVKKFTTLSATATSIEIADADTYVVKSLGPKSVIRSTDGASAFVTDITHNGTNYVIQLAGVKGKLRPNQVWTFNREQMIIDLGGNKSLDKKSIF